MLPCLVNSRTHPRQAFCHLLTSRQISFSISFLLSYFHTLPSSVSRKSFVCHSYENCRVYTNSSQFGTRSSPLHLRPVFFFRSFLERSTFQPSNAQMCFDLSPFFSHSCALLCSFLHSTKMQTLSFQAIPHSLSKNTRGGGTSLCGN